VFSGMCRRARSRDEGASCDCVRVPVFSSHISSQVSQNVMVNVSIVLRGRNSQLAFPFTW
jgi:hypothetical protein